MKIRNTKLSNERLLLSNVEVNSLGPALELEQCEIVSDCREKSLVIPGMEMVGGKFVQQDRTLSNFHFENAHFRGVSFSGNFSGCDFGDWDSTEKSSIADCDFSEARLEGCRFLNCDMDTIELPRWPCFTIVGLADARDFVLGYQWPGKVGITLDVYTDNDPECVAICGDAEQMAKASGIVLEHLRASLQLIPGVRIID